eukprot:COSAG01_NODE_9_length_43729_cov_66.133463_34_plen_351_part_00
MTISKTAFLFTTGCSGGHVYPALALAEHLAKHQAYFIVHQKKTNALILKDYPYTTYFFKKKSLLIDLLQHFFSAYRLLKKCKIQAVIATGASETIPVVLAAFIKRCPIFLLEQNTIPGRSNRLLQFFASKIFLTFAESESYFQKHKIQVTGNPICMKAPPNKQNFPIDPQVFYHPKTILVLGGSQGAQALNDFFIRYQPAICKANFNLILLCGPKYFHKKWPNQDLSYTTIHLKNKISAIYLDYWSHMAWLYQQVDYVISRAGATTISELYHYQKKAILIPYPFARDKHQDKNALCASEKNYIDMINQDELDIHLILNKLSKLKSSHLKQDSHVSTVIYKEINKRINSCS